MNKKEIDKLLLEQSSIVEFIVGHPSISLDDKRIDKALKRLKIAKEELVKNGYKFTSQI